ncbi:MAG: tol-pal system protein YbgF [Rhodobacterales bacterium]|nr:MAG: tol-pal system protein YbgF [Rhodobacterales bacterium]
MRFVIGFVAAVMLTAPLAAPLAAQEQTLADIRQELTVLHVEVQKLKRELSTTGAAGAGTTGGSALDRVAAIESELQRLTGKTEELEYRINRVVADGTNRIGDLEFRLVELEGGDVSQLGETSTLGGETGGSSGAAAPASQPVATSETDLAVGESRDFEAAEKALQAGDHAAAIDGFTRFNENYPGSPMAVRAHLGRGLALEGAGDLTQAARAFLEGFSTAPNGADAPEALFQLGRMLGRLGQTQEACTTLSEVGVRFPGGAAQGKADQEIARLGCQ